MSTLVLPSSLEFLTIMQSLSNVAEHPKSSSLNHGITVSTVGSGRKRVRK